MWSKTRALFSKYMICKVFSDIWSEKVPTAKKIKGFHWTIGSFCSIFDGLQITSNCMHLFLHILSTKLIPSTCIFYWVRCWHLRKAYINHFHFLRFCTQSCLKNSINVNLASFFLAQKLVIKLTHIHRYKKIPTQL